MVYNSIITVKFKEGIIMSKNNKPFYKKWWFILIVVIVIIGVLGSNGSKKSDTTKETAAATDNKQETKTDAPKEEPKKEVKEEVLKVSAVDLAKAYEDNEVKADKSYKDKTAEISGKVDDIGVVAGQTYVVLSAEKDFAITNVQCFFEEQAEIDKVSNLKKGDTVTIQGKIDGKSMNVGVNNCIIK